MDKYELIADGKALDEIRQSSGFYALERILKRMREDAIEALATNPTTSRKETKGKLLAIDSVLMAVDEMVTNARDLTRQDEDVLRISRGTAIEGGGTGDLT